MVASAVSGVRAEAAAQELALQVGESALVAAAGTEDGSGSEARDGLQMQAQAHTLPQLPVASTATAGAVEMPTAAFKPAMGPHSRACLLAGLPEPSSACSSRSTGAGTARCHVRQMSHPDGPPPWSGQLQARLSCPRQRHQLRLLPAACRCGRLHRCQPRPRMPQPNARWAMASAACSHHTWAANRPSSISLPGQRQQACRSQLGIYAAEQRRACGVDQAKK